METKAFVAFVLGPVQPFIAAARTVRDLWTGSYLLAHLTRTAMAPVLRPAAGGVRAIVSPDMTRDPLAEGRLRAPCLPNRFLAEVSADQATVLAQDCTNAVRTEWKRICDAVRDTLTEQVQQALSPGMSQDWADSVERLWERQVTSFFDIRTAVLAWSKCPEAVLAELLAPGRSRAEGTPEDRLWTDRADVLAGLVAAQRSVRHVPDYCPPADGNGRFPGKCSLLGTYEQLGPADMGMSARFWEAFADRVQIGGTRVRKGERLCALSLVKRFAWPVDLSTKLERNPRAMRFEDTATVAAAEWLGGRGDLNSPPIAPDEIRETNKRDGWNGQWLHWAMPAQDPLERACPDALWKMIDVKRRCQGKPPAYFGVLMLDGDHMGEWLRQRAGPDHQRAISSVLAGFALDHVEAIVDAQHLGALIYGGGDDVLALLPTARALQCCQGLRNAFAEHWQQNMPGERAATVSAGLVLAHYKEDLQFALNQARRAEKRAKDSGRDALQITVCRRSGEHTTALCPWEFVDRVCGWVAAFLPRDGRPGASDRWAYHLYGELPTLVGLPVDAMAAEIRRQVQRADEHTRQLFGGGPDAAGKRIADVFDDYRQARDGHGRPRFSTDADALRQFVTLCQTASFLARGRDE